MNLEYNHAALLESSSCMKRYRSVTVAWRLKNSENEALLGLLSLLCAIGAGGISSFGVEVLLKLAEDRVSEELESWSFSLKSTWGCLGSSAFSGWCGRGTSASGPKASETGNTCVSSICGGVCGLKGETPSGFGNRGTREPGFGVFNSNESAVPRETSEASETAVLEGNRGYAVCAVLIVLVMMLGRCSSSSEESESGADLLFSRTLRREKSVPSTAFLCNPKIWGLVENASLFSGDCLPFKAAKSFSWCWRISVFKCWTNWSKWKLKAESMRGRHRLFLNSDFFLEKQVFLFYASAIVVVKDFTASKFDFAHVWRPMACLWKLVYLTFLIKCPTVPGVFQLFSAVLKAGDGLRVAAQQDFSASPTRAPLVEWSYKPSPEKKTPK